MFVKGGVEVKEMRKLLEELLGKDNVCDCPDALKQYNDSCSFVEGITPACEAFPTRSNVW